MLIRLRVVFWGAGCLQGIFPEGRVFTRDCFGREGVYKVIGNFLGCRQILEAPWPDPVSKAVSDVPQGHHRGARFFYQSRH